MSEYNIGQWTSEENKFIVAHAPKLSDAELVSALNIRFDTNRKFYAVRKQRQRLGLKKGFGRGHIETI